MVPQRNYEYVVESTRIVQVRDKILSLAMKAEILAADPKTLPPELVSFKKHYKRFTIENKIKDLKTGKNEPLKTDIEEGKKDSLLHETQHKPAKAAEQYLENLEQCIRPYHPPSEREQGVLLESNDNVPTAEVAETDSVAEKGQSVLESNDNIPIAEVAEKDQSVLESNDNVLTAEAAETDSDAHIKNSLIHMVTVKSVIPESLPHLDELNATLPEIVSESQRGKSPPLQKESDQVAHTSPIDQAYAPNETPSDIEISAVNVLSEFPQEPPRGPLRSENESSDDIEMVEVKNVTTEQDGHSYEDSDAMSPYSPPDQLSPGGVYLSDNESESNDDEYEPTLSQETESEYDPNKHNVTHNPDGQYDPSGPSLSHGPDTEYDPDKPTLSDKHDSEYDPNQPYLYPSENSLPTQTKTPAYQSDENNSHISQSSSGPLASLPVVSSNPDGNSHFHNRDPHRDGRREHHHDGHGRRENHLNRNRMFPYPEHSHRRPPFRPSPQYGSHFNSFPPPPPIPGFPIPLPPQQPLPVLPNGRNSNHHVHIPRNQHRNQHNQGYSNQFPVFPPSGPQALFPAYINGFQYPLPPMQIPSPPIPNHLPFLPVPPHPVAPQHPSNADPAYVNGYRDNSGRNQPQKRQRYIPPRSSGSDNSDLSRYGTPEFGDMY